MTDDKGIITAANDDEWDGYETNELYGKGGSAWFPVFEAMFTQLSQAEIAVFGFVLRSEMSGAPLCMKASTIARRVHMSRSAIQRAAGNLAKRGLLIAEPQRTVRQRRVSGAIRVTVERTPTVYRVNAPTVARLLGMPAKAASEGAAEAPAHEAGDAIKPASRAAGHSQKIQSISEKEAYEKFCAAFQKRPGSKSAETWTKWEALIDEGYPIDELADLGKLYQSADLGESEKIIYPLTLLRNENLICQLIGKSPRKDQYRAENWDNPYQLEGFWHVRTSPASRFPGHFIMGSVLDFPNDAERVRKVFEAGLDEAKRHRCDPSSIDYAAFAHVARIGEPARERGADAVDAGDLRP